MTTGWICPKCGCGCAPSLQRCPCAVATMPPPQTTVPFYPLTAPPLVVAPTGVSPDDPYKITCGGLPWLSISRTLRDAPAGTC